jgi:uncharacterized protein (DUF983 family)
VSGPTGRQRQRSIEAIAFDIVLLAFTLVIVVAALQLRSPGARFVPLVVGIPTLLAIALLLLRDMQPGAGAHPRTDAAAVLPDDARRLGLDDMIAAAHAEQAADDELPVDPEARRRQAIFSVWAIGFVAAAILFGFRLTTPLALFAILIVGTRRLVLSLLVAAVASGILWVIFDAFLNVRF